MSKLKSELINKIYNNSFLCKKGHNVYWKGAEFLKLFGPHKICDKCGRQTTNDIPIRWACDECQLFYCSKCYKIIMDKYCPKKHKIQFYKSGLLEYTDYIKTYTCDNCFGKFENRNGLLFDKDCNITFCPKCYYDSTDVPDVIED